MTKRELVGAVRRAEWRPESGRRWALLGVAGIAMIAAGGWMARLHGFIG